MFGAWRNERRLIGRFNDESSRRKDVRPTSAPSHGGGSVHQKRNAERAVLDPASRWITWGGEAGGRLPENRGKLFVFASVILGTDRLARSWPLAWGSSLVHADPPPQVCWWEPLGGRRGAPFRALWIPLYCPEGHGRDRRVPPPTWPRAAAVQAGRFAGPSVMFDRALWAARRICTYSAVAWRGDPHHQRSGSVAGASATTRTVGSPCPP